jgi:T5SS/PEP-CTERM-associated repeat protein/autotransporter-associated beta strand protein
MCLSKITISCLLGILVTAAPIYAQTTSWIDGTGSWFNSANWSTGVPSSSSGAEINNGGTAQIFSGNAAARVVTLGSAAGESGTVSVSGAGSLQDDNSFDVGVSGSGTLSITNGAIVSSSRFVLADQSGSTALATVSGSGSMWNNNAGCFVGFLGTATLNITNGGKVSDTSASIGDSTGSHGTVTVDGAGSTWTQFTNVTVGGNGTGTLNITNGGKVVSGMFEDSAGGTIGQNPGSNGLATISDPGSTWMTNGSLAIADGFAGTTGTLHIMNGGAVSNSYAIVGGSGGNGTATVDGPGSSWTNNTYLYVGVTGGIGMLTVTQGGTVSDSTGYLGFGSGASNGTVEVNGAGSAWTNSNNLYVGGRETGAGGAGLLRIKNGGTVSASTTTIWNPGTIELGLNPTLNGAITFSDGKLRTIAGIALAKNMTLAAGGVLLDSNGFNSILSGILSGTGGMTKNGAGTVTLTNANTYTGATTVNAGTMLINGSINSSVTVNGGILGGTGTINGSLTVGSGGIVDLIGGTLTVNGAIINNGLFILSNGAHLAGVTSFTNNGTLDLITAGTFVPPPNFVNNGVILDSNLVKAKTVTKSGTTFTVTIASYTGHTYQFQISSSPMSNTFTNLGPPQQGSTGTVLTFADPSAAGTKGFYRIVVNP